MATVAAARVNVWSVVTEVPDTELLAPVRDTMLPPAPTGELTYVRARSDDEVDDDALRWLDEALAEEIEIDDSVLDDFDDRLTPDLS